MHGSGIKICFIAKWFRIKSTSLNKNSDLCFFSDNLYDILIKDVGHDSLLRQHKNGKKRRKNGSRIDVDSINTGVVYYCG